MPRRWMPHYRAKMRNLSLTNESFQISWDFSPKPHTAGRPMGPGPPSPGNTAALSQGMLSQHHQQHSGLLRPTERCMGWCGVSLARTHHWESAPSTQAHHITQTCRVWQPFPRKKKKKSINFSLMNNPTWGIFLSLEPFHFYTSNFNYVNLTQFDQNRMKYIIKQFNLP